MIRVQDRADRVFRAPPSTHPLVDMESWDDRGVRILAEHVITQAWADIHAESRDERTEARKFLTDQTGPWATMRSLWCEHADRCPIRLRNQSLMEMSK